ncbi:hypothetical protein [Chitinibacter sp. S2-10]|uniref:hypothetical protein n=1 Tax=Chitinibacter sp. S2-10 TaxID=3373597 RepID=UPI003977B7A3
MPPPKFRPSTNSGSEQLQPVDFQCDSGLIAMRLHSHDVTGTFHFHLAMSNAKIQLKTDLIAADACAIYLEVKAITADIPGKAGSSCHLNRNHRLNSLVLASADA